MDERTKNKQRAIVLQVAYVTAPAMLQDDEDGQAGQNETNCICFDRELNPYQTKNLGFTPLYRPGSAGEGI